MKRFTTLVLMFIGFAYQASGQWGIVPTTSFYDLNCIGFYGTNDIWVGTSWDILTSHNGGQSWQHRPLIDQLGVQITYDITGLKMNGPDDGIATGYFYIGNNQLVLRSSDDFQSWDFAYNNSMGGLDRLINDWVFPTPEIGYAVGNNYSVIKTVDGGNSWVPQVQQSDYMNAVDFLDADNGIAVGEFQIMRTSDGGVNWNIESHPEFLSCVAMASQLKIYAGHFNNTLIRSDDGGVTWQYLNAPYPDIRCLKTVGEDTLLVGTGNGIYISVSNGVYWYHFTETANYAVNNLAKNGNDWWATCDGGKLLRTDNLDNGKPQPSLHLTIDDYCPPNSVHSDIAGDPSWSYQWFFEDSLISTGNKLDWSIVVDTITYYEGEIKVVASDGLNLTEATSQIYVFAHPGIELSYPVQNVCSGEFVQLEMPEGYQYQWSPNGGLTAYDTRNPYFYGNSSTTYDVVASDFYCSDTIQVEINVNPYVPIENWVPTNTIPSLSGVRAIDFPDPLHGYGIVNNNQIQFIATEDGGENWTYSSPFTFSGTLVRPFHDIDFINKDTGFVANGAIYRTFNAGNSFDIKQFPFINGLEEVQGMYCKDAEHAFAWSGIFYSGNGGRLLKLENYADTIVEVLGNVFLSYQDMVCPTDQICYVVGLQEVPFDTTSSPIYKSTDGGNTWVELPFPSEYENALIEIESLHPDTIVALGWRGQFYKSTDGGLTWAQTILNDANIINGGTVNATMSMPTPQKIYVSFYASTDFLSEDGGDCWQVMDMGEGASNSPYDFSFPVPEVGYFSTDKLQSPYNVGNVYRFNNSPYFKLQSPLCLGDTIQIANLTPALYTNFQWLINGIQFSEEQNPNIIFTAPGVYQIQLIASNASGLSGNYAKEISILQIPESPSLAAPPTSICLLSDNILTTESPSPDLTYDWSVQPNDVAYIVGQGANANVSLFNFTDTIIISVQAVNNNGCASPLSYYSFPMGPDKPYIIQQPSGPDYLDCFAIGDTVESVFTTQAANADSIYWDIVPNNGWYKEEIGNELHLHLTEVVDFGYFNIQAFAINECGIAASNPWQLFTSPAPFFVASPSDVTVYTDNMAVMTCLTHAENGASLSWYHDGTLIDGANGNTLTINPVTAEDAGQYWCLMSGICGETVSDTANLTVLLSGTHDMNKLEALVSVIPNPSDESVRILLKNYKGNEAKLSIINVFGQELWTKRFQSYYDYEQILIDVRNWPQGLYNILFTNGEKFKITSLIVKH